MKLRVSLAFSAAERIPVGVLVDSGADTAFGALRITGAAVDLGCYEFQREFGFVERDLRISAPQTVSVVVLATGSLSVTSDSDWLVPLQRQLPDCRGSVSLDLQVLENRTGEPRTGRLTLFDGDGKELDTLPVTQSASAVRGGETYFALIAGSDANVSLVQERCRGSSAVA